jgi:hypothetical protein
MLTNYLDADACPVKDEVYHVARRYTPPHSLRLLRFLIAQIDERFVLSWHEPYFRALTITERFRLSGRFEKKRGKAMKFSVTRSSEGAVSKAPPVPGAIRGRESSAWPGEFEWHIEVNTLEELLALLRKTACGIGLFVPEQGEEFPVIEIFDDSEEG